MKLTAALAAATLSAAALAQTPLDITTTNTSAAVVNPAPGATQLITVTVALGTVPASTGVAVKIDLSPLGGSAVQPLFDNGTNGDVTAGNNIWSFLIPNVGPGPGIYVLPVTATDAQLRTALAYVNITVAPPPAPISAQIRPLVGGGFLAFSRITAGSNPASTGLAIKANLTAFGGGPNDALFDDGTNGDVTAGDGNFSRTIPVIPTAPGTYTSTFTASDAQGRSHSRTARYVVIGLIDGSDNNLNTSDVITRSIPADRGTITWCKFHTAAAAQSDGAATVAPWLDIDTFTTGAATTLTTGNGDLEDTEIGVFNAATGALVATDDDDGPNQNSQLSFGDTAPTRPNLGGGAATPAGIDGALAAGQWLLAMGNWENTFAAPFNVVSTNLFAEAGNHILNFRTNLPNAQCSNADIGRQGGVAGQDNLLDNNDFIIFIADFFNQIPSADVGKQGGIPGPDGLFDNNDFIVFIAMFFNDAANCTG